mmetsp:Transcript_13906/g.30546  ORF Transcript_13906/g.30546 Transcript_13906/m.30546 type:complete len:261 (-) Transcript_13906:267-1049(-)
MAPPGFSTPRIKTMAAMLATIVGTRASEAAGDMAAPDRASSSAKIDPATGILIKAVRVPAAPANAKISFARAADAASREPYSRRPALEPISAPAHTIGPSGPTLNPNIEVTRLSNSTGPMTSLVRGRLRVHGPGVDENISTKSATVKAESPHLDAMVPTKIPPRVTVAAMKTLEFHTPSPKSTARAAGMEVHKVCTHFPRIFPYRNPTTAVTLPTATDAPMISERNGDPSPCASAMFFTSPPPSTWDTDTTKDFGEVEIR